MQFLQLNLHVVPHLQVESAKRFVQQQHFGLVDDGSRDGDTLLLATGKGVHFTFLVARHVRHFERTAHFFLNHLRVFLLQFETESDVVEYIQMGEEGVFLEYGVDGALIRRCLRNILSF